MIRDNLAGGGRSTRDRLMPSCLFTDPQVAHVGLTEADARRRGLSVRVAKVPIAAVLRTRTIDETQGFMKAIVDDDDRILGFTMIGPEAGEVMAVVQVAMLARFPFAMLPRRGADAPDDGRGVERLVLLDRVEGSVGQAG